MFKKVLVAFLIAVCIASSAFAIDIKDSTGTTTSITVASTTTVYSGWFRMDTGAYAAVAYMISSDAGVADVTIQLQQSPINPDDAGVSDPDFQIPVNMADIVTALTTESTWYYQSMPFLPFEYARFKLTGIGSNSADTIVKIKVVQMGSVR